VSVVPAAPPLVDSTPGVLASLSKELAPSPGRWRGAVVIGLATITALVLAWTLQVPRFSAPVIAFFALLPGNVCTWRKLLARLARSAAAAVVSITMAGVLLQLPWLLLPGFFAGIALIAYFSPVTRGGPDLLAVLYPFCTAFFIGVLDPALMPTEVGQICVGYGVGMLTATVFWQLSPPQDAGPMLTGALAAGFTRARAHLAEVTARFTAERFERAPGEPPFASQFTGDMQLLERVRQERRHGENIAFLSLAIVVVDHALWLTVTMDALARRDVGRTYRRLLAPQLTALVSRVDAGLRAFEEAVREQRGRGRREGAESGPQWPDYRSAVAALEERQAALRRSGALANVDVGEEANTDAFVRTLIDLAESLQASPATLRDRVTAGLETPAALFRLDPYAARYGARVALGTTISYVVGVVADTAELFNILWHPAFLAVSSYGATIRRAGTRFAGTLIGCLVAIVATIAVMPNITELPALALVLFAVTVPSAYVALGGPRFSYVGVQIVVAFIIVALAEQAEPNANPALWRVYGTLLGTTALFLAFRFVAPDYAGRQLVARFVDVVRGMLAFLPRPGEAPLAPSQVEPTWQLIVASLPDILRLADEAQAETATGGVDTQAAIVAGGRAVRIAYRLKLIYSGRSASPRPPLSESMRAALANVDAAIRARLELDLRMLEARHTMARPGSRGFRAAYRAAGDVAAQPRPDVAGALRTLERSIDDARSTELVDWPPAARGALVAGIDHLRRLVELLPLLDEYVGRMILPGDPARLERPDPTKVG
jgi:Fusaric acid resistance protein family